MTATADQSAGIEILTGEYRQLQFGNRHSAIELDLGCGRGGYLLAMAERFPDRLLVGADVMLGRMRRVQRKVQRRELDNVRLLRVEGWELMPLLPDHVFERIHVLCPDPWPKARHRIHRLVTSEFLGRLHSKLQDGGILHLATDNQPYLTAMETAIATLSCYRSTPEGICDVADIETDFERDFAAKGVQVQHRCYRAIAANQ